MGKPWLSNKKELDELKDRVFQLKVFPQASLMVKTLVLTFLRGSFGAERSKAC